MSGGIERRANPAELHRFFEEAFDERVSRSPQMLARLGIARRQDELDDLSDAAREDDCALIRDQLRRLEAFDTAAMPPADRLNCRAFRYDAEQFLEAHRYRFNEYPLTQKFGLHTDFPAFMINVHRIDSVADALAYIARLHALPRCCDEVIAALDRREALGVVPPEFLFPQIIGDCRAFVVGHLAPEQRLTGNVLYQDFAAKLERVPGLAPLEAEGLQSRLRVALEQAVFPSYVRLIEHMSRQRGSAPVEAGAWSLPDGEGYYSACLKRHTSTDMSAEQVNELGRQEVERLQHEMLALGDRLGISGDLQTLYARALDNPDFYFPQTAEGRQRYLAGLNALIDEVSERLPELFTVLPQDALVVKAVEAHRENTAGLAFYQGPAADGSRPGVFYVNLHDMRQLPSFTMAALAYHEALPGHHMQFAIANRLRELPTFRRYGDHNAYIEGWGLYSELLTWEMGLYRDPWSDFGRLVQELKRACRLVVDTGLHARGWTREQAIGYMQRNIPSGRAQLVNEVDRYIVMPGQATSYTVGLAAILALRGRLRAALGRAFDLREFHDELLRHGPLPLHLLEEQLMAWAGSRPS